MTDLWTTLIPLIVGSAVLPIQLAITILLLRSGSGRLTAIAWVAGMTAVRLAQGIVFGFVLGTGAGTEGPTRPGPMVSTLLLVVAIVFLVSAARKLLDQPDEDAPPPRWMTMVESVTPGRALLLGAGLVTVSAKLWAFTLGAIGAIAEAGLGQAGAVATFLVFVVAAESLHLAAIGTTILMPARSAVLLERASAALARFGRPIMIALGLVFGLWFLYKALVGLGVL